MKFKLFALLFFAVFAAMACQSSGSSSDTPNLAFKRLHTAVQKKDSAAIKKEMSRTSMQFAESMAGMQKSTVEEFLKNGLTKAAMGAEFPQTRDERIKGDFAALEVQNPEGVWEDLPFVKEDGLWKLAVGDVFKGSFQSPGAPASRANAPQMMPTVMPNAVNPTVNANVPTAVVPKTGDTAIANSSGAANSANKSNGAAQTNRK